MRTPFEAIGIAEAFIVSGQRLLLLSGQDISRGHHFPDAVQPPRQNDVKRSLALGHALVDLLHHETRYFVIHFYIPALRTSWTHRTR